MRRILPALAAALLIAAPAAAQQAGGITIVAAENFYGDVAAQIAGAGAHITSILSNPDEDPHLFEANPSTARALAGAKIVIMNGADYDPWMAKLLGASKAPDRKVIVVADLAKKKAGDNPHLWYDPHTMPAVAKALAATLAAVDPANKAGYEQRVQAFLGSMKPIDEKVAGIRAKYAKVPVTATEPVFGYMAQATGLTMRNERFQLAVMNDTEPSASDVAAFERDLKGHKVRLLLYNSQATDAAAQRLVKIAEASKIPVIGVTETEPQGKSYQGWMLDQLDALEKALGSRAS